MSDDKKLNRGAIWPNRNKTEDWHPDFTGSLNVDGTEFFFDAWKRKPDASEKAPSLSFRVKRKEKQPSKEADDGWGPAAVDEPNDSIPF